MTLDINTLLVLMLANVFALGAAMPVVMGWRVSPSARYVLASALAQALGWVCFLLARPINDRLFSVLWVGLIGLGFVFVWFALRGWLGPRPGRVPMLVIAVVAPLGYGLSFDHYAVRVAFANFGPAALMLIVCLAAAWPAPHASRRWRGLLIASLGALALATIGRGVLGAFYTELLPSLRTPHPVNMTAAVLNHLALSLATIALLVAWHEEAERILREQANTDSLTGLPNRRAWSERAADALALARRHGDRMALLLLDLDHFKQINDQRGHGYGDGVLKTFADTLATQLRKGDLACRYGGEEFCVLVVRGGLQAGQEVDARIRNALKALGAVANGSVLKFSSGLAAADAQHADLDDMLRRADAALYAAKRAGRDRLVCADEPAA
jgi:diguanylate cyclase (GGDEF)-like protein